MKVHTCFGTHGKTCGVGTLEVKRIRQLQHWTNTVGSAWLDSSESEDDEELSDLKCGHEIGTLKCYYSTIHTLKAEKLPIMKPKIRNNVDLR